jgi:hypothetical protein
LFASAGTADRVLAGEDIGPSGSGPTTFVVSYHVTSFQEHFDGPEARFWVAYVVSCLTAGLGMLIAIDSRANFTHTYEFEVRVHDVRAAQVVRVSMPDGSFRNVYDTSSAPLVLRRTHSAELRSWIGAGGAPSGRELDDFLRAQAEEVARTMYALSGEDVWRAITSASRVAPPTAPPLVSSGGEVSSP